MKIYKKIMFLCNVIMSIIFMIPIIILFTNILKFNFDFQEIKYSLAGSIFGVIYISFSWYAYRNLKLR